MKKNVIKLMKMILNFIKKHAIIFIFIICFILSIILGKLDESKNLNNRYGRIAIGIGILLLAITFIILKKTKKLKNSYKTIFVFVLIFFVYLGYILNTDYNTRQHDSRSLTNWQRGGNYGYIGYIVENNHLPDFNPTEKWCFTNPPLFYIISSTFVKFQNKIGRQGYQAIEALQFMTLFFTITFLIYVYKILKELGIQKLINYIILFIGLTPGVIYLSGSINNDILAILLSTIAIYYTIRWYKSSKLSDLIKVALSIGLAMMTKINSGIIAIPIAVVFLYKLIKEKENFKKYICYYSIFAVISLPIGLWFPIKNLIKYNIPLTYIQTVKEGENSPAYVNDYSILERFFTVKKDHLKDINLSLKKGTADYNIILTTLKSIIVDEKVDYEDSIMLKASTYVLFIINVILVILFIISIFTNKKGKEDIFMYLIFLLEMIFYIKFCFDFPYTFTMNFRYIVPSIIILGYSIGKMCEEKVDALKLTKTLTLTYSFFAIALTLFIK